MSNPNTPAQITVVIMNEMNAHKAPEIVSANAQKWIFNFMNENADMLNKDLPLSHFMGMLITSAFVRVNAVNAGFYNVPDFAEALGFCNLWTLSKPIPAYAFNACKSTLNPNA